MRGAQSRRVSDRGETARPTERATTALCTLTAALCPLAAALCTLAAALCTLAAAVATTFRARFFSSLDEGREAGLDHLAEAHLRRRDRSPACSTASCSPSTLASSPSASIE